MALRLRDQDILIFESFHFFNFETSFLKKNENLFFEKLSRFSVEITTTENTSFTDKTTLL